MGLGAAFHQSIKPQTKTPDAKFIYLQTSSFGLGLGRALFFFLALQGGHVVFVVVAGVFFLARSGYSSAAAELGEIDAAEVATCILINCVSNTEKEK